MSNVYERLRSTTGFSIQLGSDTGAEIPQDLFRYLSELSREMAEMARRGGNGLLGGIFDLAAQEADLTIGRLN